MILDGYLENGTAPHRGNAQTTFTCAKNICLKETTVYTLPPKVELAILTETLTPAGH